MLSLAQALGKGQPSRDLVRSLQLQPITQQHLQACYNGTCRAPNISLSSVSGIKLLRPCLSWTSHPLAPTSPSGTWKTWEAASEATEEQSQSVWHFKRSEGSIVMGVTVLKHRLVPPHYSRIAWLPPKTKYLNRIRSFLICRIPTVGWKMTNHTQNRKYTTWTKTIYCQLPKWRH